MTRILFSSLRNEGPFIVEWVAYHRVIGFERIVIAANDCTDGSETLLQALDRLGVIEYRPNTLHGNEPPQMQAEAKARRDGVFQTGDYVMWLDLDEFLVPPTTHPTVSHLVSELQAQQADSLSLNWRIMGDSGHPGLPNGFILDQFTGASTRFHPACGPMKTLFRFSDAVGRLHLHRPLWKDGAYGQITMLDGCGQPFPEQYFTKRFKDGSPIGGTKPRRGFSRLGRINHYCVRTRLLYQLKKSRGLGFFGTNGTHLGRYTDDFFEAHNQNVTQNHDILRYRDALIVDYQRILQDPDVAFAHTATVNATLRSIPTQLPNAA